MDNLNFDDVESCKCWILSFEASCRAKKVVDKLEANNCSPVTDRFLEKCGHKALLKLISLMPNKSIENELFSEIKKTINNYIEPRKRLIIADRTNFLQLIQNAGESEIDFLARINDSAVYCEWDKLVDVNNEFIKLRFIAGLLL